MVFCSELMHSQGLASRLKYTTMQQCAKERRRAHAHAAGALFASGQTRNVDLQACAAAQMWNQRASVMLYPLVCESTVSSSPIHTAPGLPPIPHHTPSFPSTPSTSPLLCPIPPVSGGSCSIPAGPCLFISSEAAMINEALNTSSLSPGPGEPHSWVNRPGRRPTPQPRSWAWGGSTGNPLPQVETHEICQDFAVLKVHIYHDARLV